MAALIPMPGAFDAMLTEAEGPDAAMATQAAQRILIVDDDEVIASLLAALLSDAGYQPSVVTSPLEAKGTFDLVICDYLAPSFVPGQPWPHLDTLRRLAGDSRIIGCTAHQDAASGAPEVLGVSAVLTKPFDLDDVLAAVEQLLGGSAASLAN